MKLWNWKTLTWILVVVTLYGAFVVEDKLSYEISEKKDYYEQIENEEPHWEELPVKYRLADSCKTRWEGKLGKDIHDAIDYIEDETILSFVEVESGEDIYYNCNLDLKGPWNEGVLAEAETTFEGNIYTYGQVYFYRTYNCYGEKPTLFIHETLHLFGLPDRNKSDWLDVMFQSEDDGHNCKRIKILDEDKLYLENIYKTH